MSKRVMTQTISGFDEAMQVCLAVHGEDQPFTIKLIQRGSEKQTTPNVRFEHGTFAEHVCKFPAWREHGWEVFMLLGLTDGGGLKISNVSGTWALAVDLDHEISMADWMPSSIKPTFAVNTSGLRYHFCWVLAAAMAKSDAGRFLSAMSYRLHGDPCFAQVTQAVRLPGFINQKYGSEVTLAISPLESRCYSDAELSAALDVDLVAAYLCARQPKLNNTLSLQKTEYSRAQLIDDIEEALKFISADEYSVWIKVGAALHSIGEGAFHLWENWSKSSSKYEQGATQQKWKTFDVVSGVSPVSVKTIFFLAMRAGWSNPGYRNEARSTGIDSLNERTLGRLIAKKMQMDYAAVRVGVGDKESFRLLEWDGQKYAALDNVARRDRVEHQFMQLIAEMGEE